MSLMYHLVNSLDGSVTAIVLTQEDGTVLGIPVDPANKDYQEYLEWVAEGNTPLPADSE